MKQRAPEFSAGDARRPIDSCSATTSRYATILDLAQDRKGSHLPPFHRLEACASLELNWTQQAADVIGTEWRFHYAAVRRELDYRPKSLKAGLLIETPRLACAGARSRS